MSSRTRSVVRAVLTARGKSLAAFGAPSAAAALGTPFDGRCIPGSCVAPPSNTAGILSRRALPAGRGPQRGCRVGDPGAPRRLGATPDFHHGLFAFALRCRTHLPYPPFFSIV